jgi:putative endonuclease|tara:strand:+ start:105 stop:365 length:261 start_codon:yes stop_codon:yes gene_type:complete
MRYYVYLLVSLSPQKKLISYVGYTNNLQKRLNLHNSSKGAKFTKGKQWKLAYFKKYNSKIKAMKEEYILKKNTKKRNMIKKEYQLN